jgi:hypothetical protein
MYPHRIRLRGPWECEPLIRLVRHADGRLEQVEQALPPKCRVTMPGRFGDGPLAGFAGRVRFRRRFGLPRRIDAFERVWLTCAGADTKADVWLNNEFLGEQAQANEPFEFEVTGLLRERNETVVEVEAYDDQGGLWGEVALEVRCEVFLRNVRLHDTFSGECARLHAGGELVGRTELPLEIYLILDRFTVAYQALKAGSTGFELESEELPPERWQSVAGEESSLHKVRVELVQASVRWYTIEQDFAFKEDKR